MNRKNLIELMATVAATVALCGCASAPAPQHTADVRQEATKVLGSTRNAWAQCIRAAIPRLDDPQSSSDVLASDVVARAAMKSCSDEYTDMVRALARTLPPTCGRDPDCTRGALATAQREATQVVTEDVVTARVRAAGVA
ncbi:MAG TPA: hypothetical protein VGI35_07255, partial [Steroidobacteraceae bacterium]